VEGLALVLGLAGWLIASRLKFPTAAILGPMLLVGAFSAAGVIHVNFPAWFKTLLQIVVGIYLGYKIDRTALARIRMLLRPIALVTAWMVLTALGIGVLLARATHVDLATAFLGTSPGGIAEMTAMAVSVHADVTLVATLQTLRIISTLLAIPFLARNFVEPDAAAPDPRAVETARALSAVPTEYTSPIRFTWHAYLLLGVLGSFLFAALKIPAAGVIGALVVVALSRIAGADFGHPPQRLRLYAQIGLGVVIGTTFNEQTLTELRAQFVAVLLVTAATVSSALALAQVVKRWLKTDMQTALLACAPGGLMQMGIIADEMGAEVLVVNLFQLTRLVSAVLLLPILMRLLLGE
jgi:membrane AbrB-like protein